MQTLLTAALFGLILLLLFLVITRHRREGHGLRLVGAAAVWLIGFGLSQQAMERYREARKAPGGTAAARAEGPIALEHGRSASLYKVGVTPDGRTAFTIDAGGLMKVWDTATGSERWQLTAGSIGKVAASPGGQLLAVSGSDERRRRAIRLFSIQSGKPVALLAGEAVERWSIDELLFSHDGAHLLVGGQNLEAALYRLNGLDSAAASAVGEPVLLPPIPVPREAKLANYSPHHHPHMGFSADDRSLWILGRDRSWLERWSVAEAPQLLETLRFSQTHHMSPHIADDGQLGFSCDLRSLQFGPVDAQRMEDLHRVEIPFELPPGSYHSAIHCEVSPDLRFIASAAQESGNAGRFRYRVNLWRSDGSLVLADEEPPPNPPGSREVPQVAALAFTPDGGYLYGLDDLLGLHVYALRPKPLPLTVIRAEQTGTGLKGIGSVLLAASNRGVIYTHHGASKAIWVPAVTPP